MVRSFSGEYSFLSNFFPCSIMMYGKKYPSVEHAYQAAKTLDLAWREKIRLADTPAKAKYLGRRVPIRSDWGTMRVDVMRKLVERKFADVGLRAKLLLTGKQELVEGNWWNDTFWGVSDQTGKGENWLGRILMEERAKHQKGSAQ